jgi:hypothetical protein
MRDLPVVNIALADRESFLRRLNKSARGFMEQPAKTAALPNAKKPYLNLNTRRVSLTGGFAMASKFAVGDKVDQTHSNHAEGTIVAIFTNKAGEHRYAIEIPGQRTIQISSESGLVVYGN